MGGKERRDPRESVGISGKDHLTRENDGGNAVEAMTEQEEQEWQERLRAAVDQTLALRARKAALRAEFAERRKHGLTARHHNKLRRNAGDTTKENTMTDTIDLAIPTIPFTTEKGTGTITCERITDTIAITPAINHDKGFTGRFTVSATSGYRLVEATSCITCARDAAELFAAIDLDWTDTDLRHKVTDQQKIAIRYAMQPMLSCTCVGDCVADAIAAEAKLAD
jgi:hypothetical protein